MEQARKTEMPAAQNPDKVHLRTNIRKQPGDKQPDMQGTLVVPGTGLSFEGAAWAFEYETKDANTGELTIRVGFSGRTSLVARNADPREQMKQMAAAGKPDTSAISVNNIDLKPGQFVVFENTFKDQAEKRPDGSTPNRPTHYLRWNPGNGYPVVAAGIWESQSKQRYDYGKLVLGGFTQFPLPGKETDMSADAEMTPPADAAMDTAGRGRKKRADAEASMDR